MSPSSSCASWHNIPLAFFGYGFLYAWGYVSWSTASLATQAVSGGEFDLSWLVSATVVPLALVVLALVGRRRDLERAGWLYALAPALALAGTLLSVVYQHVPHEGLACVLAWASGVGTGGASALFGLLWALALAHLSMEMLEVVVPGSFAVSMLCAAVVPALPQVPALVVALLLVGACALALARARSWIATEPDGGTDVPAGSAGPAAPPESVPNIARMLVFGILAWTVMNVAPVASDAGNPLVWGVDVTAVLGYALAMVLALIIIRYAVRVDFQALALMTLPVLVLSMTLFAAGSALPGAPFWANVLNAALNSCCEIILLLYFIRIAQGRPERRAFWLALGSAASYLGVLAGQVADGLIARTDLAEADPSLFCLVVVCVYVFAMLLIPQRSYDAAPPCAPARGAAEEGRDGVAHALDGQPVSGDPALAAGDALADACARLAARYQLSAREAQVCELVARGRSQAYIRDALFLSKNSVATYVRRLYAKLDVHSKQELIDLAENPDA